MYDDEVNRIAAQIVRLSRRYHIPMGEILQDCYDATGREWANTQFTLTGWVDSLTGWVD